MNAKINTEDKNTRSCYLEIDELDGSHKVRFIGRNGSRDNSSWETVNKDRGNYKK